MPYNHGKLRKEKKRTEAAQRQEAYDKLTPNEKIQKLDAVFGKNNGAKKERMKLFGLLLISKK